MDTTERMMIMGMCLQGLLANPSIVDSAMLYGTNGEDIKGIVKLAHRYADALDPPREVINADRIAKLTRISYEALRAADADGAGKWPTFAMARNMNGMADDLDGVFERVSRWFHDPTGYPETVQDRIIAAIVAAVKAGEITQ